MRLLQHHSRLVILTALLCCTLPTNAGDLYLLQSVPEVERLTIPSAAVNEPLVKEGLALLAKSQRSPVSEQQPLRTRSRDCFRRALSVIAKKISGANTDLTEGFFAEFDFKHGVSPGGDHGVEHDETYPARLQEFSKNKELGLEIAFVLKLFADTYSRHDDYLQAVNAYEKAKDIALALNEPSLAASYETCAAFCTDYDGRSQMANSFFKAAIGMFGDQPKDKIGRLNLPVAYAGYGDCLISSSQRKQSLECFNKAIQLRGEIDPNDHEGVAEIEAKIGHRYETGEDFVNAEIHYRKALQMRLEHLTAQNAGAAVKSYRQLYLCIENNYKYDDEIQLMKDALALREKYASTAGSKQELADLHAKLGHSYSECRDYDDAINEYESALKVARSLNTNEIELFNLIREVAICHEANGQINEADACYRSNLEVARRASGESQPELRQRAVDDLVSFRINNAETSDPDAEVDKALRARLSELSSHSKGEPAHQASSASNASPDWWKENEATVYVVGALALFLFAVLGTSIWYMTRASKPPSL